MRGLIRSFRQMKNERPVVRCLVKSLDHTAYLREGVRPAIFAKHVYGELGMEHVGQIRIVVRDGGYATEQVVDSSAQEAGLVRHTQSIPRSMTRSER